MGDSKSHPKEQKKNNFRLNKAEPGDEAPSLPPAKTLEHILTPRHLGMLSEPDGQAQIIGPCGDTIEVFLKIDDGVVCKAFFLTDGCEYTIACGDAICELAEKKTVKEAFQINAEKLFDYLEGLPKDHVHCASLAANTMRKALLEYLEKRDEPWKKAYRK